MIKQKTDFINGLLLLAFGAWIWWYANSFPNLPDGNPGPALFPKVISVGFLLLGLSLLIFSWFSKATEQQELSEKAVQGQFLPLLAGLVLVCSYPLLRPVLGFLATLAIICFLMALLFKVKLPIALLAAGLTSGLVFLIFSKLLRVAL